MKIVREHINEKFAEDSDPIEDMGIGIIHLIEEWIKKINMVSRNSLCDGIPAHDIVDGYINTHKFTALPDDCGDFPEYINFGTINGDFVVSNCGLTTLRGCPKKVNGDFICDGNENLFISKDDIRKVCKVKGKIII